MLPKPLSPGVIERELKSCVFFRRLLYHNTVDSTNSTAKRLAETGAEEGTVVVAEDQTSGRGTRGRSWLSVPYMNLIFSVVLRPAIDVGDIFLVTMVASRGIVAAIEEMYPLGPAIKWPNDIYVENKKLAGILSEFTARGKTVDYVVVGIGLNANWCPEAIQALRNPATSLKRQLGREIDRQGLLVEVLKRVFEGYGLLVEGDREEIFDFWRTKSLLTGKRVTVDMGGRVVEGIAKDINQQGSLIIEDYKGEILVVKWGDVSVRI